VPPFSLGSISRRPFLSNGKEEQVQIASDEIILFEFVPVPLFFHGRNYGEQELSSLIQAANDPDPSVRHLAIDFLRETALPAAPRRVLWRR